MKTKLATLDRALLERTLARRIAADLPVFYERLQGIALQGEDQDSLKAILSMFDRLLGKPKDADEQPKQALTINIANSFGGTLDDYKITRYAKELGGDDVATTSSLSASDPATSTDDSATRNHPNSLPPLHELT